MALSVSIFKQTVSSTFGKVTLSLVTTLTVMYLFVLKKLQTHTKKLETTRHFANDIGSLNQDLDIFAEYAVTFVGLLTLHMKYGDKHPVEVVPVKPPKTNLCYAT